MTPEQLADLLYAMLQQRHTHEDPEEQEACDKSLVAATIAIMMMESAAALAALKAERGADRVLRNLAKNPNAPKA